MEAEGELWHATWTEGAEEELKEEDDLHEAGRTLVKQYRYLRQRPSIRS